MVKIFLVLIFLNCRVQSKLSNWKKDSERKLNKTDKCPTGSDSRPETLSGNFI